MKRRVVWTIFVGLLFGGLCAGPLRAQTSATASAPVVLGPYEYEVKPDDDAFRIYNPRKAPAPGPLLLREGDRLAICGDSITEQKMYSRIIETYLTVCVPQLKVTVRQYGWSGEKTDGFLRRMDRDCLTFRPTVATLSYGMNDSRYRPYDATNGRWYEDHYTAIVRRFKEHDVRVVVGSPGCAGKIAGWVKSRAGTLDQHNVHLCALRDIAMGVAEREEVRFADVFWPMLQANVFAPAQHHATPERPYEVVGRDGIHPGWAGHVLMAWAYLRAMGLDGDIGTITVDLSGGTATASAGHTVKSFQDGKLTLVSSRYPFCARGNVDDDQSMRSGMTLVPFAEELNRFVLRATGKLSGSYRVQWGEASREYSAEALSRGVLLAVDFPDNPFCDAFDKVDAAVAAKQAFETIQVKKVFHGPQGRADFEKAVAETEAQRAPLAEAVARAMVPGDAHDRDHARRPLGLAGRRVVRRDPLVGGQRFEFSDENLIAADGEMGPRRLVGDLPAVEEHELFGRRPDQQEFAALVQRQNAISVGDHAPVFAEGRGRPAGLAGLEVDASESLVAKMQVGVAVDNDRRRHVSLRLVGPALFGSELLTVRADVERERLAAIAAGEHRVFECRGGEDVHPTEGGDLRGPEYLAGLKIDTGQLVSRLNEQLPAPGDGSDDGGREGAAHHAAIVLERLPDDLGRKFLQFGNRGAGLNVKEIAFHERG